MILITSSSAGATSQQKNYVIDESDLLSVIDNSRADEVTEYTEAAPKAEKKSLPQLDVGTFPSQIFWLVTSFIALYVLISKSALPRIHDVVEQRRHRIETDLFKSETLSREALRAKQDYEALSKSAFDRSRALIDDVSASIAQTHDAEMARTDAQIVNMLHNAAEIVEKKQQDMLKNLVEYSEALAAALVQEIAGSAASDAQVQDAVSHAAQKEGY
jgi:F-type H+-transporting ATPase subunit b